MRIPIIITLALAAACGATAAQRPHRDLSRYSPKVLAGEQLCEHAVSSYERNEFLSTTTPVRQKGLFDRTATEWRRRDRVRRCQTSLSERQAACIADAPSMQYVRNCARFSELQ